MAKVLLVEDNKETASMVADFLSTEQFDVETSASATDALELLKYSRYDLIVLDWELPGVSGPTLCSEFRKSGGKTPILFLTGKTALEEKEIGFASGADDYLTKPFQLRELLIRLRALLRRPTSLLQGEISLRYLKIDLDNHKVFKKGVEVTMTPKEFALLEFMAKHTGRVFTSEELLAHVWQSVDDATNEAVRTCVKRVRGKLDLPDEPPVISTVYGVGYKIDRY